MFVALEQGRPRRRKLPDEVLVSVVTSGGHFLLGTNAGSLAVNASSGPSLTWAAAGFRCAR